MMSVLVKYFAVVKDVVGKEEETISLAENSTVDSLLNSLTKAHPNLMEWKRYLRVAVNYEYVEIAHSLKQNDEVAIIPPVSGG